MRIQCSVLLELLVACHVQEPKAGTRIVGAPIGTGAECKGGAIAIRIPADSALTAAMCVGDKNRQD